MRSLGGFRLRGEGLQRRVGGRTDYCNVQREGEGKGIEGIHVSLLRGGDGGEPAPPLLCHESWRSEESHGSTLQEGK